MFIWTKNKPTKEGWYWKRDCNGTNIVYVRKYGGQLCISNWGIPTNVEWSGPISKPKEKNETNKRERSNNRMS